MAFEWSRMYKHEENIERDVIERVEQYICEYYNIDDIEDMSEKEFEEVQQFYDEMNEYSPMCLGFSDVINRWESLQEDE